MQVFTKHLLPLGSTSRVIVIPKEWLDRNGNPENVLLYVSDSELRVSPIIESDSVTANKRAKTGESQ